MTIDGKHMTSSVDYFAMTVFYSELFGGDKTPPPPSRPLFHCAWILVIAEWKAYTASVFLCIL